MIHIDLRLSDGLTMSKDSFFHSLRLEKEKAAEVLYDFDFYQKI